MENAKGPTSRTNFFTSFLPTIPEKGGRKLEKAFKYVEAGQFSKAREIYQKIVLVHGNNPEAWLGLGITYLSDGEEGHVDAFRCIKKGADLEHSESIYMLGLMYKHGNGVKEDQYEATRCFQKVKDVNADALDELGEQYYYGEGIEKNIDAAYDCFCRAEEQGCVQAKYHLGVYYFDHGVMEAATASTPAISSRDQHSHLSLTQQYYKKAFNYFSEPDLDDNPGALYFLGVMHLEGLGAMAINISVAIGNFKKAADLGNINAMRHLGYLYEGGGYLLVKDISSAGEYYSKAALLGDEMSAKPLMRLAKKFAIGDGVKVDRDLAQQYYLDATYLDPDKKAHVLRLAEINLKKAKDYQRYDKIEKAKEHLEYAKDLLEAQAMLAQILKGQPAQALELYRDSLELAVETGAISEKLNAEISWVAKFGPYMAGANSEGISDQPTSSTASIQSATTSTSLQSTPSSSSQQSTRSSSSQNSTPNLDGKTRDKF